MIEIHIIALGAILCALGAVAYWLGWTCARNAARERMEVLRTVRLLAEMGMLDASGARGELRVRV